MVAGVDAVGEAVDATPWQLFSCARQSLPENAFPANAAQALNWCMHAAEAAPGRSMKISSRTMKDPMFPVTPGATPPRLRTKTKKEMTSTMIVVVLAVVIDDLLWCQYEKNWKTRKRGRRTNVVASADVAFVLVVSRLVVVPALPLTKVAVKLLARLVVVLILALTEVVLEARLVVVFVLAFTKVVVVAARLVVVFVLTLIKVVVVLAELVVDFAVFTEVVEVAVWPRGRIFPSTMPCNILVLMVAATTTPFPSKVWVTGLPANPKIVSHPKEGTGPKLVAKRLAKNVNRLFDAPGAGEPAPVNNFSFKAINSPDSAYLVQ
jgi:hypothetical protein